MINYIKIPLTLFIATTLSAIIITTMHQVSVPILEARTKEILNNAFDEIYAENLDEYTLIEEEISEEVLAVYTVTLNDNTKETVFEMVETGRNGPIKMLISYNMNGDITNINYLESTETPGIGTKILDESFIGTIIGQNSSSPEIDTIAGATISSNAVKLAVETSSELIEKGEYNE